MLLFSSRYITSSSTSNIYENKKTYIRSRIALLVGLLSLHTLSSCVNSGQLLGISNYVSKPEASEPTVIIANSEEIRNIAEILNSYKPLPKRHWYKSRKCYWAMGGIIATLALTSGMVAVFYPGSSESESVEGTTEATPSTTAIELGNMTGLLSILRTLKSNDLNDNDPMITTSMPDDSTAFILNSIEGLYSKVLTQEILSDLRAHDFSERRLKHWVLTQKLDINAKDQEGRTILMYAALGAPINSITFLIDNGAKVNLQDAHGYTALMCATLANEPEILDLLLNKKADPCIKNNVGSSAKSFATQSSKRNIIMPKLEAAEKLCKAPLPKQLMAST